jgi:hypothetical protein
VVRFVARHEAEHGTEDACECGGIDIDCVASAEWPALYHGVLDVPLGRLGHREEHDLGTLRFPCAGSAVTRAFLVCGYDVQGLRRRSDGPDSLDPGSGVRTREYCGSISNAEEA